jgi:hypothetical protein
MSTVIFIAVIDELVRELNNSGRGGSVVDDKQLACMAFADDLVLLADNELQITPMLWR